MGASVTYERVAMAFATVLILVAGWLFTIVIGTQQRAFEKLDQHSSAMTENQVMIAGAFKDYERVLVKIDRLDERIRAFEKDCSQR